MEDLNVFSEYPTNVVERFTLFHEKNPDLYEEFKVLAFKMKNSGKKKYSARTIMEVLRWNKDISTVGYVFDINNDFIPLYIRLLISENPEFDGFFELRRVRSRGRKSDEEITRENSEVVI